MMWFLERYGQVAYEQVNAMVVRAGTESQARDYAADECGDEGREAWLEETQSRCTQLHGQGAPGLILSSFNAG